MVTYANKLLQDLSIPFVRVCRPASGIKRTSETDKTLLGRSKSQPSQKADPTGSASHSGREPEPCYRENAHRPILPSSTRAQPCTTPASRDATETVPSAAPGLSRRGHRYPDQAPLRLVEELAPIRAIISGSISLSPRMTTWLHWPPAPRTTTLFRAGAVPSMFSPFVSLVWIQSSNHPVTAVFGSSHPRLAARHHVGAPRLSTPFPN